MEARRLRVRHKALLRREGFVPHKFLLIKETAQDIEFIERKTKRLLTVRI